MPPAVGRKFLVDPGRWHPGPTRGIRYRQGYLSLDPARIVRVRRSESEAVLTIKGPNVGTARSEFDYPIPLPDADLLLEQFCHRPMIEKVRFIQPFAGHTWEVDVFEGDNRGLIIAEVELGSPEEPFKLPPWVGREVSADPRFFNAALIQHPFSSWHLAQAGRPSEAHLSRLP